MSAMNVLEPGNPHILKFMNRKAPVLPGEVIRPRMIIREEDTHIKYPMDVSGTILLKNMSMRMAVKAPDDKAPVIPRTEVHGRLKSDITENKEKIYERSYY